MSNNSFRAPNGYPSSSSLARAEFFSTGRFDDEETRDPPDNEALTALVETMFDNVAKAFEDTSLATNLDSVLSSLTYAFHHQVDRAQRALDDNESRLRQAREEDDASEISSVKLERLMAHAEVLEGKRDAFEHLRDASANAYAEHTGSVWRPATRSMVNHRNKTAASVSSNDYINAKRYQETNILIPQGTKIAFSGGYACTDVQGIWDTLDKVRAKYPDMVLLHTAGAKGADAIAKAWAANRGVTDIPFPMKKRNADDRAAPFRRNDLLLASWPKGVIVYPGTGITDNLADKARQNGITLFDRRGSKTQPQTNKGA
jgi:hypothetical protein